MPKDRGAHVRPTAPHSVAHPDDHSLVAAAIHGDDAALRTLMDRYDRLVRYTIFRTAKRQCVRDPQWLDTVASDSWTGLLRSLRREPGKRPTLLSTYLTAIARNQTLSALRRLRPGLSDPPRQSGSEHMADLTAPHPEPVDFLSDLDSLALLRECLADLPEADKIILSQLNAITQRRWNEAGEALGMSESTLRSRWKRILDRLRECVARKSGSGVAPEDDRSD
ncbi:MAG: sigma-70 family RNA polymerase sigma factor [Planctomycetota bacterium]